MLVWNADLVISVPNHNIQDITKSVIIHLITEVNCNKTANRLGQGTVGFSGSINDA